MATKPCRWPIYGPDAAFDNGSYCYFQVCSVVLLQNGLISGADVNVYRDIVRCIGLNKIGGDDSAREECGSRVRFGIYDASYYDKAYIPKRTLDRWSWRCIPLRRWYEEVVFRHFEFELGGGSGREASLGGKQQVFERKPPKLQYFPPKLRYLVDLTP